MAQYNFFRLVQGIGYFNRVRMVDTSSIFFF